MYVEIGKPYTLRQSETCTVWMKLFVPIAHVFDIKEKK